MSDGDEATEEERGEADAILHGTSGLHAPCPDAHVLAARFAQGISAANEGLLAGVDRARAELEADAKQLVVLRDAV